MDFSPLIVVSIFHHHIKNSATHKKYAIWIKLLILDILKQDKRK